MSLFNKNASASPSSATSSSSAAAAATAADLLSRLTAGDSKSAAVVAPRNGKSVFVSTRNLLNAASVGAAAAADAIPVPSPMARSPSSPCFGGLLVARKQKGRGRKDMKPRS